MATGPAPRHLQAVVVNPSDLGDVVPLFLPTELQALEELPSLVVLDLLIVQLLFPSAWTLL